MIQTQLLKSDKPYQIISAAGMVGIQVATLIVTEEKTLDDGRYIIDTHSHPVVNYANKEGLVEELKYFNGDYSNPIDTYHYTKRMQPEGAVWNKIEVRDVRVLGLVGANNISVDLGAFLFLIPSINPDKPHEHLWDGTAASKMRNLIFSMEKVGIKVARQVEDLRTEYNSYYNSDRIIFLELEEAEGQHQVLVNIRDEDYEGVYPIVPLYFRCHLGDNPEDCISIIRSCFIEIMANFDLQGKPKFVLKRKETDKEKEWNDLLERVADKLNSYNWVTNTYPTEG